MNVLSYLIRTVIGALIYYALGKLGHLLILPPGQGAVFWPAAGWALALAVYYGNGAAPAIFLGAIATTLSGSATTDLTFDTRLFALIVASGATLQAIAGNFLIRHYLKPPFALENIREILLILFLGGIVAGAVNSISSNAYLYLSDIIPERGIARNWLIRYVGDVIGIFLFCPLSLLLLSPFNEVSLRRKIIVSLAFTCMLALVNFLFFALRDWEMQNERLEFDQGATEITKSLRDDLATYPAVLESMAAFFAASEEVTAKEFQTFSRHYLRGHSTIYSLSWNPKVLQDERESFVQHIRAQGYPEFDITRRLVDGSVVTSEVRPIYFPVTYIAPFKRNQKAHGFDTYAFDGTGGDLRKNTLDAARLEGKPITTGRIQIVQSSDPYSLILYSPVYVNARLPAPQKTEMENLRGYLAAVLRINQIVADVVDRAASRGMHFILTDQSAKQNRRLLYDSRTPDGHESPTPLEVDPQALVHTSFLTFAGHGLEINLLQKDEAIGKYLHLASIIGLFGGLLFTGLLSTLLLVVTGRTQQVERLISEKVDELGEIGSILEHSLNEIYILDEETLRFIHVNESALRNLQYDMDELRFMSPSDICAECTQDKLLEYVKALTNGTAEKVNFRAKHLRKDGSSYEVEVYLQRMQHRGQNVILAMAMDISDKAKVENSLQSQQHDMAVIFDNVPVRIWYKDDKNNILRLNKAAAEAMGGHTVEEFEGKSTYDLFPEMAKQYHDDDLEVISTGRPKLGIVERFTPRDGMVGWSLTDKVPYYDPETGCKGVFAVSQDITERKIAEDNLEQAVEKLTSSNEELERFAYIASHDLQEPLRMVRNFTELLEKRYGSKLDDTAKSYIAIASSSAKHMQGLVDDLLDYARVEHTVDKIEIVDPEHTLDYVKTSLHDRIIKSSAIISSDPFPSISVNPISFSCLMQNLIGNGLKYHNPGTTPRIYVGVKEEPTEWVFSVNDNGIGMKEEYLSQIFQPFKRLHTREEYAGTGMGLAICRKTVENMGGRIWVESKVGVGSTFYFTVPKQDWEL